MVTDIIQWARVTDLTVVVDALTWPNPSYMYLERVPERWLTKDERDAGLRLEKLDPDTPFNTWERGRLFCHEFELRWEKIDGAFQTVYVGAAVDLADFQRAEEPDISTIEPATRHYFLWGERTPANQLDAIGATARDDAAVFLELIVSRVLYYPVSDEERNNRVRLQVCEYIDPHSGERLYYRFQDLEEVAV